jgi:hypothetical protein
VKKKAQAKLRFSGIRFSKDKTPPHAGEGSLLRWFWSFTGASGTVAARIAAALVVLCLPV